LAGRDSARVLQATSIIGGESGLITTVLTEMSAFKGRIGHGLRVRRNFFYWHETDITDLAGKVRSRGQTGSRFSLVEGPSLTPTGHSRSRVSANDVILEASQFGG
jgi:hypothetical protein